MKPWYLNHSLTYYFLKQLWGEKICNNYRKHLQKFIDLRTSKFCFKLLMFLVNQCVQLQFLLLFSRKNITRIVNLIVEITIYGRSNNLHCILPNKMDVNNVTTLSTSSVYIRATIFDLLLFRIVNANEDVSKMKDVNISIINLQILANLQEFIVEDVSH